MGYDRSDYQYKEKLAKVSFLYLEEKSENTYLNDTYAGFKKKIKVNAIVLGIFSCLILLTAFLQDQLMHSTSQLYNSGVLTKDANAGNMVFGLMLVVFEINSAIFVVVCIAAFVKIIRTSYRLWWNSDSALAVKLSKKRGNDNISSMLFESNVRLSRYMNEIEVLEKQLKINHDDNYGL